jgi:hypothetical protein
MAIGKANALGCAIALVMAVGMTLLVYDLLFSKPDHLDGVITEKNICSRKNCNRSHSLWWRAQR